MWCATLWATNNCIGFSGMIGCDPPANWKLEKGFTSNRTCFLPRNVRNCKCSYLKTQTFGNLQVLPIFESKNSNIFLKW